MPSMIALLLPSASQQRELARSLVIRAMNRLGEGDVNGAWMDIQAIHRVARHVATGVTLIEWLVGIAVDSIAFEAERELLRSPALTAEQLRRYLADHQRLPPLPNVARALNVGERYMCLDTSQFVARRGIRNVFNTIKMIEALSGALPVPVLVAATQQRRASGTAPALGPDWNVAMQTVNDWMDRLVRAARDPDVNKQRAQLEQIGTELKKLRTQFTPARMLLLVLQGRQKAGKAIGNLLALMLLPGSQRTVEAERLALARRRVMRVGMAAESFRRQKGRYPQRLEELAHIASKRDMADSMTAQPLRLLSSKTGLVIYSVGRNLRDERGRQQTDTEAGDDVAVRLGNVAGAR